MKRFSLLALLFAFVISLNGCAEKSVPFTVESFESEVEITDSDNSFCGRYVFENDNSMFFEFSYPSEISGLRIVYSECGCSAVYADLEVDIERSPSASPVVELFSAVRLLSRDSAQVSEEGETTLSLENAGTEYTYKINCNENRIMEITNSETKISFIYQS